VSATAEPAGKALGGEEPEESVTDLIEQLGRDLSALVYYEGRLAASRRKPELWRAGRDGATGLVAALAFLTAFGLANAAAVEALSNALSGWLAALALAVAWAVVGAALALFLRARLRQVSGPPKDFEVARDEAEQSLRATLDRLTPALSRAIASEVVPGVASGMASGVLDVGEDLLESSDDVVEELVEDLPVGGLVNRVWDVALAPGRFGVRIATTVLKGDPRDS
jgi:Putative Actinobacterial Holin-X, holin superfamily III